MIAIDRELPIATLNNVIAATNTDVDVAANNVEIMTLRWCQQEVAGPKMLMSRRQDRRLIDTDKLNGVTDYKWIIYFY